MGENDRVNERQAGTRNTQTHSEKGRVREGKSLFGWLVS